MTDVLDQAAALCAAAGDATSAGDLTEARRSTAAAVLLLSSHLGEGGDTRRLWCQVQEELAGLDRMEDDLTSAERRLHEVLTTATADLGPHSDEVVSANNSLGVTYKAAGRLDDAAAAYRRALTAFGPDDRRDLATAATLAHNLAGLDHARGRTRSGITHGERGLKLRTSIVGDDHPDIARDLDNLGALHQQAGRLTDADTAHRRALHIFETAYGPNHLEVGMALANLAVVATSTGRHEEAEAHNRRSLAILEQVYGPDHPEVGLTLFNLAITLADQHRHDDAVAISQRAVRILEASLPEDHPTLVAVRASSLDL